MRCHFSTRALKAQYRPRAPTSTAHTCVLESIRRKCYNLFYGKGGKKSGLKLGKQMTGEKKNKHH